MSVSNNYLNHVTLGLILVGFTILIGTAANAWNETIQIGIRRNVVKRREKEGRATANEESSEVLGEFERASFNFVITLTAIILLLVIIIAWIARKSSTAKRLIS